MTMPLIFCLLGAALAASAFYFFSKLDSSRSGKDELDHAIQTLPQIHAQLPRLLELDGPARDSICKTIAKDIRKDCVLLTVVIWQRLQYAHPDQTLTKPTDSQHPAYTVLREVQRLNRNIKRILLLARRRPARIRDGRHIAYAALQHNRVWIEYMRFLRNLYPETYTGLVLPGETPLTFARSA